MYVDLGQPCEDRAGDPEEGPATAGRSRPASSTPSEELCRDFAFPVLQWQAKYEGIYLLGTSIARPLISKVCLQVAREVGADAYAHGATGKGNDQCRFQLAAEALEPGDEDHRPLADRKSSATQFPGRTEMIAYCDAEEDSRSRRRSPSPTAATRTACTSATRPASSKTRPSTASTIVDFGMTVSPQEAPDKVEQVTIGFERGVPVTRERQEAQPARDRRRR